MDKKERIKAGIAFMVFFYALTIPFALYYDNTIARELCQGLDADLVGYMESTRPLPSSIYTEQYFGNAFHKMNKTSFTEYSTIYIYLELNGNGIFVSDQPGLRNESDWFIHKTNQYGMDWKG